MITGRHFLRSEISCCFFDLKAMSDLKNYVGRAMNVLA